MRAARWSWLRHWDFWLAMLLGTLPRLWNLQFSEMVGDQINYLTLARESLERHAFPLTGLQFTIGVRSNPVDILLTIPFVLGGKDPFPDVVFIALFSVLGLALCYVFALREFGRRVAFIATLLLAGAGYAFDYSRFLWQLSYDPTLLVLWGMTLYAGGVRGRRGWLLPNAVLLFIMVSLHPTALALVPITLVAILLGPNAPRPREYAWIAAAAAAFALPTVVWEVLSHGYDLPALLHFSAGHAVVNGDVFPLLYDVLGPPTTPYANFSVAYAATTPDAPYALLDPILPWMRRGIILLYPAAYLVLTGLTLAPAVAALRALPSAASRWDGLRARAAALWRGLRSSPRWRALLLLWLWVTLPPLSMLRHSSPLHGHYLLIVYPAIFLTVGVAAEWAVAWLIPAFVRGLSAALPDRRERAIRLGITAALYAALGCFAAGQVAENVLYLASVDQGKITTVGMYHPLGEMQSADAQLRALQRARGARAVYVVNHFDEYPSSITYLLVRDEPGRMSFAGPCLILPPAGAGPTLVVSTLSTTPAAALLPALPNATHLADIAMPGGEPYRVYQVAGATPALPGERAVGPFVFGDAAGAGLRLDAAAIVAPGVLRLRWTVLASTAAHRLPLFYAMQARAVTAAGGAGGLLAGATCQPTQWQAGQTVFTWLTAPAPPAPPGSPPAPPPAWSADRVMLQVASHTADFWTSSVGPLRFLSGVRVDSKQIALTPVPAAPTGSSAGSGQIDGSGRLILPLSAPTP